MKVRNRRIREWVFIPDEESKLKKNSYTFKYKSKLLKFINGNLKECLNGTVSIEEHYFNSSYTVRVWDVWVNEKSYSSGATLKADLRQVLWRGKKFVSKPNKIEKADKKYFTYSDKIINLMLHIGNDINNGISINPSNAKNLYKLFLKRGYKDFEPTENELDYINNNIEKGISFYYWSDRCNWLRCKTIIEYFKRNNLI